MDPNEPRKEMDRKFFLCADISKKKMRRIILIDDRKRQKKLLIKSLNIQFNGYLQEGNTDKKTSIKIEVDNFLPNELNSRVSSSKKEKDKCEDTEYIYQMYILKREKMIKIIYDFFYNILLFCIKKNLSLKEISTFLSIKKNVLMKLINNCQNIIDLFVDFKRTMLVHSIRRIPFSIKVFSFASLQLLINYSLNTFFKHFSWYKFIFTPSYKIYFECVDTSIGKSQYESTDIKITDEAWSCNANEDNIEIIKEILNLNVGDLCSFESFEQNNEDDTVQNEISTYFAKAGLGRDGVMFEMNTLKNEPILEKIVKQIQNNEETKETVIKEDEHIKELKQLLINKEKLIKKMEHIYKDVEDRILSRLNEILEE